MNKNSFLDDATELKVLLEGLSVKFVHHIYMLRIASDSLGYYVKDDSGKEHVNILLF